MEVAVNSNDALARFARVHLSTPAERAVYFVLAGSPAVSWSAQELSERTGVSEETVSGVLERFAAAGIIGAAVEAGGPCRYRWRVDKEYLYESTTGSTGWIDPVCGMEVMADSPLIARAIDGSLVRFCSPLCRAAFRAFPGSFAPSRSTGKAAS